MSLRSQPPLSDEGRNEHSSDFSPLAGAKVDRIDEALIERYAQQRRKDVAPATVNRELATLR